MAVYIGDGCYAEFDGYAMVAWTSDGITEKNRIVLEPEVFDALVQYRQLMMRKAGTAIASAPMGEPPPEGEP